MLIFGGLRQKAPNPPYTFNRTLRSAVRTRGTSLFICHLASIDASTF